MVTKRTVRIATGGDGLSDIIRVEDHRVAAIKVGGTWATANITFRGSTEPPEAFTGVVPTGTVAGLAVDANANDIQMTNAVTLQVNGGTYATPVKVDPIDISTLISAAATINTSKHGVLWVFQSTAGTVDVDTDVTTADYATAIEAFAQYAKPTRTLPPSSGMVPIGAVRVTEGGSGAFTWGTDSITAETEAYFDFFGTPEVLVRAASLALDAGAATFTYGATTIRLGTGVRVAMSGKANVAITGTDVAAGKVGAWLIYGLADDVEYALQLGYDYPSLASAQGAVASHTKNPYLALIGAMYVQNIHAASAFDPGTTFLDASGLASTTFVTYGPRLSNIYIDEGTELSVTAAADRLILLAGDTKENLVGPVYLQLRSGTSGTPVDQTGSPTVDVMLERTK